MPAVEKVAVNDHGFLPASASVQALLAPKATATLCKRMCSMRTHSGWYNLSRLPQSAALFEEAHVFTNVKEIYNDGAPASRGAALCEAINFVGRLLGVCVDAVRKSSRVRGMGCTLLRTRAATRRRRPLTVSMVMELGKAVVEDEGRGEPDAIVAWAALFAVHGQLRAGDLRRCIEEPELDLTEGVGFLETHFTEHKTARAGTKRALPIACAADGLTSMLWGRWWLQARAARGLRGDLQQTVLPAMHRLHHARVLRSLQGGPSSLGASAVRISRMSAPTRSRLRR